MSWKRKRSYTGKNEKYNLSRKLRQEGRINETFEITLANLTLEEVIGLKLQLSSTKLQLLKQLELEWRSSKQKLLYVLRV